MATKSTQTQIDEALGDLEQLADEIRVKLHLASMDAKQTWETKLEPKLHEARGYAKEAKDASKKAIHDVFAAFKEFSESL